MLRSALATFPAGPDIIALQRLAAHDAAIAERCGVHPEAGRELCRAAAAVAINITEGQVRLSTRERQRFLAYALRAVRECIVWYCVARDILTDATRGARLDLLTRIRADVAAAQFQNSQRTPYTLSRRGMR
jgi:four helix bundle protein